MTKKRLLAACLTLGSFPLLLALWSPAGSAPSAAADQPAEKSGLPPKPAEQSPNSAGFPSPKKAARVVQFELTEEYDRGLLPPGRRVGLTVRVLGDLGKSPAGNIVAIVESADSARTLVSLMPGRDSIALEGTASVQLPALGETMASDGASRDGQGGSVQLTRVNVTFARLQGMRLDPMFKRRVYLALGQNGSGPSAVVQNVAAPGEIRISTTAASTAPDEEPPSVRGIVDEAVIETDLMHGTPMPTELRSYWRELGRRIRHRWAERNAAVVQEKTVRPPRIRFRLYPSGVVQTIYLERSSGNARVDIAGLESVLDTQPFLPIPSGLGESFVNVHVQFHGEHTKR